MRVYLVLFISTTDPVKGPYPRSIDLFTSSAKNLTSVGHEVMCDLFDDECRSFADGLERVAENLAGFPNLYSWMYPLLSSSLGVRVQELIQQKTGRIVGLCMMPTAEAAYNEQVDVQYVRGVLDGAIWGQRFAQARALRVIRDRRDRLMAKANEKGDGPDNDLRVNERVNYVEQARALESAANEIERGR